MKSMRAVIKVDFGVPEDSTPENTNIDFAVTATVNGEALQAEDVIIRDVEISEEY